MNTKSLQTPFNSPSAMIDMMDKEMFCIFTVQILSAWAVFSASKF